MNVLVTGGAGFQGSHLVEALVAQGHAVRILNTPSVEAHKNLKALDYTDNIEIVWGSVRERNLVFTSVQNIDLVYHLAAEINVDKSLKDPALFIKANVLGTMNVLDAVRTMGIRMIHASTCEVYGGAEYKPMDEGHPINPMSPYAASKAGADRLCYAYAKSFGVEVVIARPFNIYGPRQKMGKFGAVIPIFAQMVMAGASPTIYGEGDQTRDYLYVSDLVDAYMVMALKHLEPGTVINFGSGVETSIKYLALGLCERINTLVQPKHEEARPGEVKSFVADIDRAMEMGWRPKVDIRTGLDLYVDSLQMGPGVPDAEDVFL